MLRIVVFGSSGGKFASRMRLCPIPTTISRTVEISPVVCLYTLSPLVGFRMSCMKWESVNFMKTCLRVPSIWIINTDCSVTFSPEWIHSCMSKAVRRGLEWSKQHAKVFWRSLMTGLLYRPSSEYSTWGGAYSALNTTLTRDYLGRLHQHYLPLPLLGANWDSNPRSQQARGRRPTA